ncbi:hypothetical protein ACQPYK_20715 [Streptosporangium sp. CA-135522]|uniref:hypothetical protein n=1 Tax=Streptosporangium sp. CA-135522 TaxID=3240072 RepID=UPI003D92D7CB
MPGPRRLVRQALRSLRRQVGAARRPTADRHASSTSSDIHAGFSSTVMPAVQTTSLGSATSAGYGRTWPARVPGRQHTERLLFMPLRTPHGERDTAWP